MKPVLIHLFAFCLLYTAKPALAQQFRYPKYLSQDSVYAQHWRLEPLDSISLSGEVMQKDSLIPLKLTQESLYQIDTSLQYSTAVQAYVDYFLQKRSHSLESVFGLAAYYEPYILPILSAYKLPSYLSLLPMLLTGYQENYRSPKGRSGIWAQPHTQARSVGLEIDSYIDERHNFIKQSHAVAQYLKQLFEVFGNYCFVVDAYVNSPGFVHQMQKNALTCDYQELIANKISLAKPAYPALVALYYLYTHAKELGLKARPLQAAPPIDTVWVSQKLHFTQLDSLLGVSTAKLKLYNPYYRRGVIFGKSGEKALLLPAGLQDDYERLKDSIPKYKVEAYFAKSHKVPRFHAAKYRVPKNHVLVYYRVKTGDNLGFIAEWFDTRVSRIKRWNGIRNSRRLRAGKRLKLFVPKSKKAYYAVVDSKSFAWKQRNRAGR